MATELVTPVVDLEDLEYCELLDGRLVRKPSVGRINHSDLEIVVRELLKPYAQKLGCRIGHEWTMLNGPDKLIPDVTLAFPNSQVRDGYLVAPAFLVIETSSKYQQLSTLFKKCRNKYHPFGTPYCWVIDSEEEVGYECHKQDNGLFRLVEILTAGDEVQLSVAAIFEELKKQTAIA